jgi:5S rRNA maturation endonuclease (ribonuclease M5)
VVNLQPKQRDISRARQVSGILEALRHGTVVVEGMHDVRTLRSLGIGAVTCSRLAGSLPDVGRTVYVLMDSDRGGEEKKRKVLATLLESDKRYAIDDALGRRLLKMLNATSIEQVYGPISELMDRRERAKGNKK